MPGRRMARCLAVAAACGALLPVRTLAGPGGPPPAALTRAACTEQIAYAHTPADLSRLGAPWRTTMTSPGCAGAGPAGAASHPAAGSAAAPSGPVITTVAGGGIGDGGDPLQAEYFLPSAETFDSAGNLYVSTQGRVEELSPGHVPSTFAGTGTIGFRAYPAYLGDGGDRRDANFGNGGPGGIAFDSHGDAYIADTGNGVVRKIDATGTVSTFAGGANLSTADYGAEGADPRSVFLWAPDGVAVDSAGDVFIADSGWCTIREVKASDGRIYTFAGIPPEQNLATRGTCTYTADGVPALGSALNQPKDLHVDSKGDLLVADLGNCRIREVTTAGLIETIAGTGVTDSGTGQCVDSGDGGAATAAGVAYPWHFGLDGHDNVYIAEYFNQVIRRVDATTGVVSTFAGTEGVHGFAGDGGPATQAQLAYPLGVAVDPSGNVDIADFGNNRIRRVDSSGTITTIAGNGLPPYSCSGSFCGYFGDGYSGDGLAARDATLSSPSSVAVDGSGNLFVADAGNDRVREVDAATGLIHTVAGDGTVGHTGTGGPATAAEIAVSSVAVDANGVLYIGEAGGIRKVDAAGNLVPVAGGGSSLGDGGPATGAQLGDVTGMAFDAAGNLDLVDAAQARVRRIDPGGTITTIAGDGTAGYAGDAGPATAAQLNRPIGIAVERDGSIDIADMGNQRVRHVDALTGVITTIAGDGTQGWNGDGGAATGTELSYPIGVGADAAGNVYVADTDNCVLREVDAGSGTIHVVAGSPPSGPQTTPTFLNCDFGGDGGPASQSFLFSPTAVTVAPGGAVYFVDAINQRVRELSAAPAAGTPEAPGVPLLPAVGIPALAVVALGTRRRRRMPG